MASTIKLSTTAAWAQTFCHLIPLTGQGGTAGEPALTIANNTRQFMLAPPFAWRWNRTKVQFTCTAATQDYIVAAATFGWIERASVSDGTTMWQLTPRLTLPDADDSGRPLDIAPESDDDQGNVTFRLFPVPDSSVTYTVTVVYQNKPVIFTSLAGLWSPIPDEMAYIYNAGFLSGALENIDDARFAVEYQKFVRSLIAANDGLTDEEKSIFLTDRLYGPREQADMQMGVQQGRQSRGA